MPTAMGNVFLAFHEAWDTIIIVGLAGGFHEEENL